MAAATAADSLPLAAAAVGRMSPRAMCSRSNRGQGPPSYAGSLGSVDIKAFAGGLTLERKEDIQHEPKLRKLLGPNARVCRGRAALLHADLAHEHVVHRRYGCAFSRHPEHHRRT